MSSLSQVESESPDAPSSGSARGRFLASVTDRAAVVIDEAPTSRRFAAIYVVSFLAVILLAIVINFLGNGTNLLPSPGFPSGCDRAWKARRLESLARSASPPTAIVIGSSRVTAFEPQYIEEVTDRHCFNFGVSVGCPVDYLTQFRFLLRLGIKPDLLVVGVDEWAFGHNSQCDFYDLQLVTHPGLFRQAPLIEELWILGKALKTITIKSTRTSFANLWRKAMGVPTPWDDTSDNYLDDGLSKPFSRAHQEPNRRQLLVEGINDKVKFWSALVDNALKVEGMRPQPPMTGYFREFMALAREHGVHVYVALLPVHPVYEQQVFTPRLREIREELSVLLRDTCREFECEYRDFSSLKSFDGDPEDFIDGTHPTTRNARRMIDELLRHRPDKLTAPRSAMRHDRPQRANSLRTSLASASD
jgi:hypothetical protein